METKSLRTLRKQELVDLLESAGEVVDQTMTAEELRSIWKEIKSVGSKVKLPDFNKTKKAGLQELLTEWGVSYPKTATKPQLMRMIRAAAKERAPPQGGDFVMIGKVKGMTYSEVFETQPGWTKWAIEEYKTCEEGTSMELGRFAKWAIDRQTGKGSEAKKLTTRTESPELVPIARTTTTTVTYGRRSARGSSGSPKRRAPASDTDEMLQEDDSEVTERQLDSQERKMMIGAMSSIMQRLDAMAIEIKAVKDTAAKSEAGSSEDFLRKKELLTKNEKKDVMS